MAGIPTEASILGMLERAMPGRVKNVCAHRSGGGKYMAILQMCKKAPADEGRQRQAALLAFSAFPELKHVVLVVREAPLSAVHLRNMYELARFGAVVFPPVPAWYAKPQSLEEAERQIAARILAQFGVEAPGAPCWG